MKVKLSVPELGRLVALLTAHGTVDDRGLRDMLAHVLAGHVERGRARVERQLAAKAQAGATARMFARTGRKGQG